MLRKITWAVAAGAALLSVASAEERAQTSVTASTEPLKLTDAELEKVTAGLGGKTNAGVTVVVLNPGGGYVFKNVGPGNTICVNCAGTSPKTWGFIVTPQGKQIQIGGN